MSALRRQSHTYDSICQYFAAIAALLALIVAHAGEVATEPLPAESVVPLAEAVTTAEGKAEPMHLLNTDIPPGTAMRLSWSATELFEGVPVSTPVLVVNGAFPVIRMGVRPQESRIH